MKISHIRIRKHIDIKVQCIEIYKPINELSSRFNVVEAERNELEGENVKTQRMRITEEGAAGKLVVEFMWLIESEKSV